MTFEGRIEKSGRLWLAEVPALDALTQGRTKREGLEMVKDLFETMADRKGFEVDVHMTGSQVFEIEANDVGILLALLLRRQREKSGLTLADVAERLGQRSRNAFARYEQGKAQPTVEKLEQLLRAVAPDHRIVWRFAA